METATVWGDTYRLGNDLIAICKTPSVLHENFFSLLLRLTKEKEEVITTALQYIKGSKEDSQNEVLKTLSSPLVQE